MWCTRDFSREKNYFADFMYYTCNKDFAFDYVYIYVIIYSIY